jgi:hypothetical protein
MKLNTYKFYINFIKYPKILQNNIFIEYYSLENILYFCIFKISDGIYWKTIVFIGPNIIKYN